MDQLINNRSLRDEFLPELEISITPSKLSTIYKVDLYRLSDDFIEYLVHHAVLGDDDNNDVHIMSLQKVMQFIDTIREHYVMYRATQVDGVI